MEELSEKDKAAGVRIVKADMTFLEAEHARVLAAQSVDPLRAQTATGEGNVPPRQRKPAPVNVAPLAGALDMPPCDIDAEMSVIGGLLMDEGGGERTDRVFETLIADDFYSEPCKAMYRVLHDLYRAGEPTWDAVIFRAAITLQSMTQACGGDADLLAVMDKVPSAASLPHYVGIVADRAQKRRLMTGGTQIRALGYDWELTTAELVQRAESILHAATESSAANRSAEWLSAGETNSAYLLDLIDRLKGEKSTVTGVSTGLLALDRLIPGFAPGTAHVWAGRPGMGKTGALLTAGDNMAAAGHNVAFFSQEMSKEAIAQRRLSKFAKIDSRRLQKAAPHAMLSNTERDEIKKASAKIDKLPFFIDDTAGLTVDAMRSRLRRLIAKQGPVACVFIDYLQIIGVDKGAKGDKRIEIGDIMRGLKIMAKEFHTAVIVLSQLSRAVEKREDKRPIPSDLMESSEIEAVAETISFIYRPAYYADASDTPELPGYVDDVEWIIPKQRDGVSNYMARLGFRPHYTEFVDLDERHG